MNLSANIIAVLLSAVASMVIGSIWYGPLFGKRFMFLMGLDKLDKSAQEAMKKKMPLLYFSQFIASIVMFYVLAVLIGAFGMLTISGGLQVAFLVWLGIVVPLAYGRSIWGGSLGLFWLEVGNMFLTLLAAGAIIGVFG